MIITIPPNTWTNVPNSTLQIKHNAARSLPCPTIDGVISFPVGKDIILWQVRNIRDAVVHLNV